MMQIKQYNDGKGGLGNTIRNVLRLRRGGGGGGNEVVSNEGGMSSTMMMSTSSASYSFKKSRKKGYTPFDKTEQPSTSSPNVLRHKRSVTYPLRTNHDQVWGPPPAMRPTKDVVTNGLTNSRSVMGIELEEEEAEGLMLGEEVKGKDEKRQSRLYAHNRIPQSDSTISTRQMSHQRYPSEPVKSHANHLSTASSSSTGLRRSNSITSTPRARPQGRTPSAAELQKRSSQFVGYWCPYPSTVFENASQEAVGLSISTSNEIKEETFDSVGVLEEMDESIDDRAAILPSLRSNESMIANPNSHEPQQTLTHDDDEQSVWAVSRGWKRGIYSTHAEANKQIEGFPGPLLRQFESTVEANDWLTKTASDAQKIPSVRTMDIDEEFGGLPKNKNEILPNSDSFNSLFRNSFISPILT